MPEATRLYTERMRTLRYLRRLFTFGKFHELDQAVWVGALQQDQPSYSRGNRFPLNLNYPGSNLASVACVADVLSENAEKIAHAEFKAFQLNYVAQILFEYLELIKELVIPKLHAHYNNAEILIWAELKDEDWETKKKLIIAEAKINGKYHEYGFTMTSTFLEESDRHPVPAHYRSLL